MVNFIGRYNQGTATVASGGTTVTITGAGNLQNIVRPGASFIRDGLVALIEAVPTTSTLTLTRPWPGPAATNQVYEIGFAPYENGYREGVQTIIDTFGSPDGVIGSLTGESPVNSSLMGFDAGGAFVQRNAEEAINFLGAQPVVNFSQNQVFGRIAAGNGPGTALTGAQARTALGAGATGNTLFQSETPAAARTALALGAAATQPYESGTFIPTFDTISGTFNPTYSAQQGSYTRVGALVFCQIYIVMTSFTGAGGALRINGFPITRANATSQRSRFGASFWSGLDLGTGFGGLYGFMQDTGASARLYRESSTSSTSFVSTSMITGTVTIYGTVTYEAA